MPRTSRTQPERLRCFYCGDPVLPSRVEHDHFPKPACAGGTETVPACPQCHDLKDRTHWRDLPLEMKAAFFEEFAGMSRISKIAFAQLIRLAYESDLAVRSVMKVHISTPEIGEITEACGPPTPLADYIARVALPLLAGGKPVTLTT